MPHPNIQDGKPNERFKTKLKHLKRKIASKIQQKVIMSDNEASENLEGIQINGNHLAKLAEKYVKAINSSSIPVIQDAYSYINKDICRSCYESCKEKFIASFKEKLSLLNPSSKDELTKICHNLETQILKEYYSKAFDEYKDHYESKLKVDIYKI